MATASPGPGALVWVHPLTVGVGLLGAVVYGAWELLGDEPGAWLRGGLALAAAVGLGVYLHSLRGTLARRLTPGGSPDP